MTTQLNFEWDPVKAKANQKKHGVSFEMVENFDWTTAFVVADERFEYGEERRFAIGMIGMGGMKLGMIGASGASGL